jgi:plasmid stability protein
MATLTIKNLPEELYAALKNAATENCRSVEHEAIVRLERGLECGSPNIAATLESIRLNRDEMSKKGIWLTDEILYRGKNEGRQS